MAIPRVFIAAATIILAMSGVAQAKDPAYVGTWADTAAQCKMPADTIDAPMMIRAKGYDQFETHCDFSAIKKTGSAWTMKAACSVDGDQQTEPLKLKVAGKKLVFQWGTGAAITMVRCR